MDPNARLAADALEFRTYTVDLKGVDGKTGLMEAVDAGLQLPDYFGRNWDALLDVLTDLSWDPAPGYLVLVEGSDRAAKAAPEDFVQLCDVLAEATIRMHGHGRGLHAIVSGRGARSAALAGVDQWRICDHFWDRDEA